MLFNQAEYDLRCEWGLPGLLSLAPISDAIVIVDVLSFSTAVDIAVANGASVVPAPWKPGSGERSISKYSLSPSSLRQIPEGTELILPSPNGSTLSLSTGTTRTCTACLRNAAAVAEHLARTAKRIAVIPAGERWSDNSLRPCLEDWLGAGAILSLLSGAKSPEAEMAASSFERFRGDLPNTLLNCGSGRELIERGFREDILLAANYGASRAVPTLIAGTYRNRAPT